MTLDDDHNFSKQSMPTPSDTVSSELLTVFVLYVCIKTLNPFVFLLTRTKDRGGLTSTLAGDNDVSICEHT